MSARFCGYCVANHVDTTSESGVICSCACHGEWGEPPPLKNDKPAVWDLVKADIARRDEFGLKKYGTRLQPHNGRDALKDAYEEALDLTVYLRQAMYERDGR